MLKQTDHLVDKVSEIINRDPVVARAALSVILKEMWKRQKIDKREFRAKVLINCIAIENGIDLTEVRNAQS